jgi:glucose-6-phosphate 1-dehydrogenase
VPSALATGYGNSIPYCPAPATEAQRRTETFAEVLLHVFNGNPTLFIRDDEAEELWRIVEPILDTWGRSH